MEQLDQALGFGRCFGLFLGLQEKWFDPVIMCGCLGEGFNNDGRLLELDPEAEMD